MVLLLITALTGAYTYSQRGMWGYRISGADLAQLEALAAKPALAANRVGVLQFSDLTVRCVCERCELCIGTRAWRCASA